MTADLEELGRTLFAEGKNCWRVAAADRFGWLIDGEQYFGALRRSMETAEQEILVVGWDMDSGVHLIRDEDDPFYPSPLAETLERLAAARPGLRVHVLSWDFAMIYVLERELLPAYRFGWQSSERLHFHLDGKHATGASHHQKFVVIDGGLAFVGGLDITKNRWDTREHRDEEPRRMNRTGERYRPFHDVQAIVSGAPARLLRKLGAFRWENATGTPLPDLDGPRCDWPEGVTVRGRDIRAALARTWTSPDGSEVIREVERLFLDMIAAARTSIYIENQYFTSDTVTGALCERLREPDGPEVLIVLPGETSGWLEQATMDVLRGSAIRRLRAADEHDRLAIVAPVDDGLSGPGINVHSKILIVDDRYVRIGSANLSRRSMGLDSECDLVIDDDGAQLAAELRADLLAEHLGAELEAVRETCTDRGLLAVLAAHGAGPKRLEPIHRDPSEIDDVLEPVARIADLEKPVERVWSEIVERVGDDTDARAGREQAVASSTASWRLPFLLPSSSIFGWSFLVVLVLAAFAWAVWKAQDASDGFDLAALLAGLREIAAHPAAPFAAVPAFVAGSLLIAPVTGMIALCALAFGPWTASLTAIAGTLAATAVNHLIGHRLGRAVAERAPEGVFKKMRALGRSSDVWSLAGLRLIPIAPFTVVNLLAGAAHVRLRDFLLGTLISMGPGVVVICFSVDRARAALAGEPVFEPWLVATLIGAGVLLVGLRVLSARRSS